MRTNNLAYSLIFKTVGMLFCIVPVTAAILSYFPIWIGTGGVKVLSGFTLILCVIAHVPLIKAAKNLFKSPASYTVWLFIFVAFLILSSIAEEMTVISFVGFLGNLVGAVMFKLEGVFKSKAGIDNEKRN